MGYPIANYTVFKLLAEGANHKQKGFELNKALDAIYDYSVFAFILYDPNEHKSFKYFIEGNFKSLHYSTGRNLAFFGLVNSPENFEVEGFNPSYNNIRKDIDLYGNDNLSSYTAFAFTQSLHLKPEDLPAIIISHDPRLKSFKWYKTSSETLELQLSRLTSIANELFFKKELGQNATLDIQETLFRMLQEKNLDLNNRSGIEKLSETIAKILSDILSFSVPDETTSDNQIKHISKQHQKDSLRKATLTLKVLKEHAQKHEEPLKGSTSAIEALSVKLATFITLSQLKQSGQIEFEQLNLENDSLHFWQTGNNVQHYLQTNKLTQDFSPSAICFAKMFEQEINNSVGHWIRNEKGIKLPEFFNKKEPGKNAYFDDVDFNKGRNGKWMPPELGKSKYLARNKIPQTKWQDMGIKEYRTLLKEWNVIHEIRNRAAHTEIVTNIEVEKLKHSLLSLEKKHIFRDLQLLKKRFTSENSN